MQPAGKPQLPLTAHSTALGMQGSYAVVKGTTFVRLRSKSSSSRGGALLVSGYEYCELSHTMVDGTNSGGLFGGAWVDGVTYTWVGNSTFENVPSKGAL